MFDEETYRTAMNVMDRDSRSGQHSIITPQPFMEHVPTPHFIDLSPSINSKLDRPDSRFNSTSSSDNYSSKENRRMKSGSYGDLMGVERGDHRSFNPYLSSHNDNNDGNSSNVRKDWAEQIFNRNNYGDRYYGRPPLQQQQRRQQRPQQQFKNKPVSRSIDNIEQQTQQRYRSATQYRPPLYSPMSSDNEGRSSSDYFNRQYSGNSRTDYRTVSESEDPNSFRRRYYEESVSSDDRSNVHPSRYTMKTQQQQFEQMNLSPRSMFSGSESGDEILVVKRACTVGNKFEMKPSIARQAIRSYGSHSRLDSNNNNIGMHSNNNNNYYDDNRNDTSADPDRIAREYWENRWISGDYNNSSSRNNNPRYSHRQQYNSSDNLLNNNFSSSSRERFSSTRTSSNSRDNNNSSSNNVSNRTVLKNVSNNNNNSSSSNANNDSGVGKDKEFLKKIQQELESQRMNWTGEIDKLLSPMSADLERTRSPFANYTNSSPSPSSPSLHPTFNAEKNSFIDTSGPMAIFKAFVDVSDYPTKSVSVRMDNWSNKVIVEASQDENPVSHVATSFTQKIPLPKYADVDAMSAKVNRKGIVKIEVPLLFYFPQDHQDQKSSASTSGRFSYSSNNNNLYGKSYVYEVKTNPNDGSKVMEIVVKPGADVSTKDIRVEVSALDRQLVILAERSGKGGVAGRKEIIKTYTLPETAIIDGIKSKMQADGLVLVSVPIRK